MLHSRPYPHDKLKTLLLGRYVITASRAAFSPCLESHCCHYQEQSLSICLELQSIQENPPIKSKMTSEIIFLVSRTFKVAFYTSIFPAILCLCNRSKGSRAAASMPSSSSECSSPEITTVMTSILGRGYTHAFISPHYLRFST